MEEPKIPFPFQQDKRYPVSRDISIVRFDTVHGPVFLSEEDGTDFQRVGTIRKGATVVILGKAKSKLKDAEGRFECAGIEGHDGIILLMHPNHLDARTPYSRKHHAEHEAHWIQRMRDLGHWPD